MRLGFSLSIAGLLLSLTLSASAAPLSFGVVPQQSANKLAKLWTPVFLYLSDKTGEEIRFATANDIPAFEQRLLRGEYDFAYMNPYHYTVFHQKPGYQALARQKDKRIQGILVVRIDSPIQSLEALNQQVVAFPSPAAFAASVLPQAQLMRDGIAVEPRYVSSHDSVYLNVARGFMVAGGGVMRTFNNTAPEVREQLRILWTTPGYTPHAIAVHPRVDERVVLKIQAALANMHLDPEGAALLKSININAFDSAADADWDDVRSLNIQLLAPLLEKRDGDGEP